MPRRRFLMRPSEIRFSQDTICSTFSDGDHVNTVANEVATGHLEVEDFTTMEVFRKDDEYYTRNNRMLYVFRVAEYRDCLDEQVPVFIVKRIAMDDSRRLTTKNDGVTVIVRNSAKTLDHYDYDKWDLIMD